MKHNKNFLSSTILVLCLFAVGSSSQKEDNIEQKNDTNETSNDIQEESYNIVRPDYIPDYDNYDVSEKPTGFNMTYYSDIYSRGFSWLTNEEVDITELYLVKSDKGADADFSNAEKITGKSVKLSYDTSGNITADGLTSAKGSGNSKEFKIMSHKVHVENLEKGKAYSYKAGSEKGYYYGAFVVEKENPNSVTAIHMSDAQTKDLSKHNIWRNTVAKAVKTAGNDLDMIIHNGDQFDQNNTSGNDKEPFRLFRYAKALDVIQDYKFNVPYMTSSGNHEPSSPYSHYIMSDINYAGYDYKGAYYSYDYNYAHFVVLNSNTIDDAQINWLKDDLSKASNAKWKIVTMHISPYSTGDHSNKSENQNIVEKLTPIFSEKHVDLVLQAHDHIYNKTLPYKWDAAGYTTTYNNNEVVNFNVSQETKDNVLYDVNPEGTYYVTTGAAGHRNGASESDGIWAEVVTENGEIKGLNPSKTFTTNKYKIEVGKLTQSNKYESYTFSSYTSSQDYKAGDPATGNVNATMFGVLNLTEDTLSYHAYTVNGETVKLFDTLDVLKNN
ncbi:MAG: metallophosphoesterase [Bacilli bacterium]|nr:metallophosphoesterase [Bacilli bacterium]